ncbi:tyrosine-type recombinase/integrase [Nocardioides sambongensis]|uniref:tyrosine-type recombinase/integrase n=1 Tax=Nocardioides sambongensis TaxID=2589074 RepID=UPI00112CE38D|nr:site-specific integrase [Nocardioides sambongensis]
MRGEGSVYQTKVRGKTMWCAQITGFDSTVLDADGKAKRWYVRGFGATPQQAIRRRQANLLKRAQGGAVETRSRSPKLSAYLDTWLDDYPPEKLSPETRRKYRRDLEHHVLPYCDKQIADLSESDLKRLFYLTLPPLASPAARWNAYKTLRTMLNHAVKHGVIRSSPLVHVSIPNRTTAVREGDKKWINRRVSITKRMLDWLEDPANPHHEHFPRTLMMFLGLRRSEILGLEWNCITNLHRKGKAHIIVKQQLKRHEDGSGWYIYPATKNRKDRIVPLPERWRLALVAQKEKQRAATEEWAKDLVFLTPHGRRTDYNTHANAWTRVLTAYVNKKQPDEPINPDFYWRPHASRHITASLLFDQGVALEVVQDILGHSDTAITLYYTHLTRAKKQAAVQALEAGLKGGSQQHQREGAG